jgi:hypothetical protein
MCYSFKYHLQFLVGALCAPVMCKTNLDSSFMAHHSMSFPLQRMTICRVNFYAAVDKYFFHLPDFVMKYHF